MAYNKGATNTARNHNFVSFYEAHKPDISEEQVQRYGNSIVGFLDLVDAKKATTSLEFSRFEKDRIMPKIKATNGGAGAAGAAVAFTLAADTKLTSPSASPYDTSAVPSQVSVPVKLNDLIMLKPATGTTASFGSYIQAIVTAVNGSTAFTATPTNVLDAIPNMASADEIIIFGNAHGEGSGFQAPMSTKSTKFTEKLQIIKHRMRVTGSESLVKEWYTEKSSGESKFMVKGEGDGYAQFMNISELNLLVGETLSNTTLASTFQATNNPLAMTNGLLTQIITGGNILNYNGVSGLVLNDFYDFNVAIDAEKAQKKNLMMSGIEIDQDLDVILGDKLKDGAISYGGFNLDQEKSVNLSFQKFTIGAYSYDKRSMGAFNDKQTLGAAGYGFKHEAFTIPAGSVKVEAGYERGTSIPSLRKRFLANESKSRELSCTYYNGIEQSAEGTDIEEVRYMSHTALEAQALNQYGYIKRV